MSFIRKSDILFEASRIRGAFVGNADRDFTSNKPPVIVLLMAEKSDEADIHKKLLYSLQRCDKSCDFNFIIIAEVDAMLPGWVQ